MPTSTMSVKHGRTTGTENGGLVQLDGLGGGVWWVL